MPEAGRLASASLKTEISAALPPGEAIPEISTFARPIIADGYM